MLFLGKSSGFSLTRVQPDLITGYLQVNMSATFQKRTKRCDSSKQIHGGLSISMHPVPALDVDESVIPGSHAQDGWDSSLDILWQLEQQESNLTLQPEQKELSFIESQPSNAIVQPFDYSAGSHATATDRQADETQRRLLNRRIAQKRFRERQKARIIVVLLKRPYVRGVYHVLQML